MTTRHQGVRSTCALAILVALAACGGDGGSTQPTETLGGLTITPGTTAIKIGASETYTATATYSTGRTQVVTATWESDAAVLTIDGSGRAFGVAAGLATITARYQGWARTLLIHVVPDYQGTWAGDYAVTTCEVSGAFVGADLCGSDGMRPGDLLPVSLLITQSGIQLSGTFYLGEISGPLSGTIDDGGTFNGTASLTFTAEGQTLATAVNPLRTRAEGERMTGTFRAESTLAGVSGSWVFAGEFRTVTRQSSGVAPLGVDRATFATLRDARDAFRRR